MCSQLGVDDADRDDVLAAARLHDIGKASVPREILEKPGPLDAEEWDLMRAHTVVGEQILGSVTELEGIARLVRYSHERWDGDGYPDGLAGDEIPLGSRIIFCADAFHAIRCNRPYRMGRSADRALAEVKRCSGTQFDPRVVAALEEVVRELRLTTQGRPRRSSRLAALLLVLALGFAGSAVARSDLLGAPSPSGSGAGQAQAAPGQPLVCGFAGCPPLLESTVADQIEAFKVEAKARQDAVAAREGFVANEGEGKGLKGDMGLKPDRGKGLSGGDREGTKGLTGTSPTVSGGNPSHDRGSGGGSSSSGDSGGGGNTGGGGGHAGRKGNGLGHGRGGGNSGVGAGNGGGTGLPQGNANGQVEGVGYGQLKK
jgi:hypothetical protein